MSLSLSRSLKLNLSHWLSQRLNSLLLHNSKSLNLSPNPSHRLLKSLLPPHSLKSPELRSS